MTDTPARILIVDDDPAIRMSMSLVLSGLGYRVQSAVDGFSALRSIREEMPDILLTDLNMPGMSGFELLTVVWRRFPAIQKIAMSGAYSGNVVPSGVAADAFFQKGSSVGELLRIIREQPRTEHCVSQHLGSRAPLRIDLDRLGSASAACVTIACPECLRAFSRPIGGPSGFMFETDCVHCGSLIQYAIVEPAGRRKARALNRVRRTPALTA
jgi:CheY-like chemotaxis protein